MDLLPDVRGGGSFSNDEQHRFVLSRDWVDEREKVWGNVVWIMLNPSTATHLEDDPTVRRCQSFSRAWGYDGIIVVNLFGLRATDPKDLKTHPDPVGGRNDAAIQYYLEEKEKYGLVVAAWGVHGTYLNRGGVVASLAHQVGRTLHCLGTTKDGHPKHPLYVKGDTELRQWECQDPEFGLPRL